MTNSLRGLRPILVVALAGAALLLPGAALRQDKDSAAPAPHPNFSGRWRMVKDKSNFGGFTVPDIVVRVVDQHDPVFSLHTIQTTGQKTTRSELTYSTDNNPTTNTIGGREAECHAFWDGPALIVRTNTTAAGGEKEMIEDRWELSNDGKTLTTTSHIVTEKREATLTMVCEKEDSAKGA